METKHGIALGAALFAFALLSLPAMAGNITERERRDCQADYHKYCSEYGLGTEALRACMSRNIKKISNVCVAALVDAGDMTQAQAHKLRGKAKTTIKKKSTKKAKTTKKPTHKKVTTKSSKKKR